MARPLRIEYEGALYHITARGNERAKIFFTPADYEKLLVYIKEAGDKFGTVLHAYVFMTNHYHLIVETPHAKLSRAMHHINGSYTTYVNNKRKRSGHLFQGRYKAIIIDKDSYLLELSRYIHLNPVRAGLAARPQDYPYSSYRAFVFGKEANGINRGMILGMLSKGTKDAVRRYRQFVEGAIGTELENQMHHVYGGFILGRRHFIKGVLKKVEHTYLMKEETSHRRALQSLDGIEDILGAVATHLNMSREALINNVDPQARKIAIYLSKTNTAATNRHIGEVFGNLSYSAVAKIHNRFPEQIKTDKAVKKITEQIQKNLSKVKG